jgi:hypothetical protein
VKIFPEGSKGGRAVLWARDQPLAKTRFFPSPLPSRTRAKHALPRPACAREVPPGVHHLGHKRSSVPCG